MAKLAGRNFLVVAGSVLLGMGVALQGASLRSDDRPKVSDAVLSQTRGLSPSNQSSEYAFTCDDLNAGTGISSAACARITTAPPSNPTCIYCDATGTSWSVSSTNTFGPMTPNGTSDCDGDAYTGSCICVRINTRPPTWDCDCVLPDNPNGTCTGTLQLWTHQ